MAKQKLTKAHEEFSRKMMQRLRDKERQGWAGWDEIDFNAFDIPRRLQEKSLDVLLGECSHKDLVDIANFAMFLHWKLDKG